MPTPDERWAKARKTYNHCGICGFVPKKRDEPNRTLRWWDPDDGWKIGALCAGCWGEAARERPAPGDFAYDRTNSVADDVNTDEDPMQAIGEED